MALAALLLLGTVSKKLSAPYRSGPSRTWIKVQEPGCAGSNAGIGWDVLTLNSSGLLVLNSRSDFTDTSPGSWSKAVPDFSFGFPICGSNDALTEQFVGLSKIVVRQA